MSGLLRKHIEFFRSQAESMVDAWRAVIGAQPHLAQWFVGPDGNPDNEYKALVQLRLNERYNKIPTDSDASIYTQGLLGGKFIGITAGGADTYLKDKGQIDFTQSAFVLENLIGQVLANFTKSKADEQDSAASAGAKSNADTKSKEKTK